MAQQYESPTRTNGSHITRGYAQVVGVILILMAILGFVLGDQALLGIFNIDFAENTIRLVTGGLMCYAGFSHRDNIFLRNVVGGLGVIYLLVCLLGFLTPTMFGLLPHGYSIFDNLLHIVIGILGIVVGFVLPGNAAR